MHVLQINPLLPLFDIFSGTHVRPCVQVATPLQFKSQEVILLTNVVVAVAVGSDLLNLPNQL